MIGGAALDATELRILDMISSVTTRKCISAKKSTNVQFAMPVNTSLIFLNFLKNFSFRSFQDLVALVN